jgi:hypothetical protein
MGINIGDVIEDDGDVNDGVNVAARLEGIAPRGGICISRQVLDLIEGKVDLACRELGRQKLKNIARPVEVYGIDLYGEGARILADFDLKQEIRYCSAPDGVRLAYAKVGSGPPLMRAGHWYRSSGVRRWELSISAKFPLMRGSATWRRLPMLPVLTDLRCSAFRKAAPSPSPTR